MDQKKEKPCQDPPDVPVELFVEFDALVQDYQKYGSDQKKDEMKIQSLFLFRPLSGFFVEFVI